MTISGLRAGFAKVQHPGTIPSIRVVPSCQDSSEASEFPTPSTEAEQCQSQIVQVPEFTSGSQRHGAPCITIAKLGRSIRVGVSRWLLVFDDAHLEGMYAMQMTMNFHRPKQLANLVLILCSLHALSGGDHDLAEQPAPLLRWDTLSHQCYNVSWLAALLWGMVLFASACFRRGQPTSCISERWAASCLSLGVLSRCLLGNSLLLADLFVQDPEAEGVARGAAVERPSLELAMLAVYLGACARLRLLVLLLPLALLALSHSALGGVLACAGELSARQAGQGAALLALAALVLVGRWRQEAVRRLALLQEVEAESQVLALQVQRESKRRQSAELTELRRGQLALFQEVRSERLKRGLGGQEQQPSQEHLSIVATPECVEPPEALPDPTGGSDEGALPNDFLREALPPGAQTDWQAANRAVSQIRDPAYSLRHFHEDIVAAFPELGLYTFSPHCPDDTEASGLCSQEVLSSGRSRADELARTFGAFYAIYWLMRIDLDGMQGFCFGCDKEWRLKPFPDANSGEGRSPKGFCDMSPAERRLHSFHHFPWAECGRLFASAGLLQPQEAKADATAEAEAEASGQCNSRPATRVGVERLRALLALTAMHDVMKNEALCPRVQPGHAPFCGYQEGETIHDHDAALSYVLTFYAKLFPSYRDLDAESQGLVRFTQGRMGFNNGWLVQGEAPPGALFHNFKQVITDSHASTEDVAFYFVHWITDLAGAEPTPLGGSEKLVLKMPDFIVQSFFSSMSYVWRLSVSTETQVLHEYLRAQWLNNSCLGPLPMGDDSIAIMRLALQVQSRADLARGAFESLSPADREVLTEELSLTGLPGQSYSGSRARSGCPALLVYYGPALLQRNADRLVGALAVLAEVYRKGRSIFPLRLNSFAEGENSNSTSTDVHTAVIRIEQLKDLCPPELGAPQTKRLADVECFFLVRKGDLEAVVEKHPLPMVNRFTAEGIRFSILDI